MVSASAQRTKLQTRQQRRQVVSKQNQTDPAKVKLKTLTAKQRREVLQQRRQVDQAAARANDVLRKAQFKNISEANKFIRSLDPVIRSRVTVNPKNVLDQQKSQITSKLRQAEKDVFNEKLSKSKRKAASAERVQAQKTLDQLNKGQFVNLEVAIKNIDIAGSAAKRRIEARKSLSREDKLKKEVKRLKKIEIELQNKVFSRPKQQTKTRNGKPILITEATQISTGEKFFLGEGGEKFKSKDAAIKSIKDKLAKVEAEKKKFMGKDIPEDLQKIITRQKLDIPTIEVEIFNPKTRRLETFTVKDDRIKNRKVGLGAKDKADFVLISAVQRGVLTSGDISFLKEKGIEDPKKAFEKVKEEITPAEFKKLNKNIQDTIKKDLFDQLNSPRYKALTKQTLTPSELKSLENLAIKQSKDISKQQITLIKKIPGFVKSAPTSIALAVYEFGTDVLVLSKNAVVGSFNYGRSLTGRAASERNRVIDQLGKDLLKVNKTLFNIRKFVQENPLQAAALAGAFITASAKQTKSDFIKDPVKTTTRVLLEIFVPLKAGEKLSSILERTRPGFIRSKKGEFIIKGKRKSLFDSVKDFLKGKKIKELDLFKKNPDIVLKTQTVKTGAQPLSKQALLAGEVVTAVNAAADQLTSWIKRKRIVRKPIPGEENFPTSIKKSLLKFDKGIKLPVKEFARTNKWLQKNVAPNITLLERSLYADPASGFRVSRLAIGKEKKATFKDILRGNFTLRSPKPQVLIFQNAKVAKFPKSLKDVEKKLKAGKKLTTSETNKLISWQVETGSGKFKPIGSTIYKGGVELEVTLAPGELIKRVKRVGFTIIEGKKVDFVTAEVFKPTKAVLNKIKKAQSGKLEAKEILKLEKDLSKKLGRKIKIDNPNLKKLARRRTSRDVPVLRVEGTLLKNLARATSAIKRDSTRPKQPKLTRPKKPSPVRPRKPTPPKPDKPRPKKPDSPRPRKPTPPKPDKPRPKKPDSPRAKKITVSRITPLSPTRRKKLSTIPLKTPIINIPRLKFDSKELQNKLLTFEGVFRERKDPNKPFTKANTRVVKRKFRGTKNDVTNRIFNLADNKLVASGDIKVVSVGKFKRDKVLDRKLAAKFNIKKSKNTPVLKFVEKNKFRIDTRGEKKGLRILKKKKQSSSRKK